MRGYLAGRRRFGYAQGALCAWAVGKATEKRVKIQPDSSVPCEQSENSERFPLNEVPCQIFCRSEIRSVPRERCKKQNNNSARGLLGFHSTIKRTISKAVIKFLLQKDAPHAISTAGRKLECHCFCVGLLTMTINIPQRINE